MINLIITIALGAQCQVMKTNILSPYTKQDIDALIEWKMKCLETKAFTCLIEFIKKENGSYLGVCSAPLQDK